MVERANLWKVAEELFKEGPDEVIAVAKVQKSAPGILQLARNKKKINKVTNKPRVVVLVGSWHEASARVKLVLHTCKQSGNTYSVSKTYQLSNVSRLEVYNGEPGMPNSVQALELFFYGGSKDENVCFQVPDEDTLLQILAPLWHFLTKYPVAEQKRPTLSTHPGNTVSLIVQIEAWNGRHLDQAIERKLTSMQCGGGDASKKEDEPEEENRLSLVSAKEERDLQMLLDRFTFEVSDLADFQHRLQCELAALEAANVRAILESNPSVARVRDSLNDALALLDDVNENLATFDTKLKVMREDIAAIEARNNRLELQTRNNGKLLIALDSLLAKLQLPAAVEKSLKTLRFSEATLDAMVEAGWELYDHLEGLTEAPPGDPGAKGISHCLSNMDAVAEQRQRFAVMGNEYVERATHFIGDELLRMSDQALQATVEMQGGTECHMPDHTELQEELNDLMSLLHVVRSLKPDVINALGEKYTSAFNALLRREVRMYTSVLRKLVVTSAPKLPAEPVLIRGQKKEDLRSLHSFTTMGAASRQPSALSLRDVPRSAPQGALAPSPESYAVEGATQPHEAFEKLLKDWVPFLRDQLDLCADFLMLKDEHGPARPQASVVSFAGMDLLQSIHSSERPAPGKESGQLIPGGLAVLEALIKDVDMDFLAVVDLVSRQQQVQSVAMLGLLLKWQAAVGDASNVAPLHDILVHCGLRLMANFESFLDEMIAGVIRFEPRRGVGPKAEGVKSTHILPFVPNFAAMVVRLEALQESAQVVKPEAFLAEEHEKEEEEEDEGGYDPDRAFQRSDDSEEEDDMRREESLAFGNLTTTGNWRANTGQPQDIHALRKQIQGGMDALKRAPGMGLKAMRKRGTGSSASQIRVTHNLMDSDSGPGSPSSSPRRILTEAEIPDHLPELRLLTSIRDLVNPVYAILTRAIFGAIDRIASSDPKHGIRLSLENYIQFETSLKPLAANNAVLAFFVRRATSNKEKALQAYVQQQLEYGNFWRLIEFSAGLSQLVSEVGPEEVPFQPGYQIADLRHLFATTAHHCGKRLTGVHARIEKHLANSPDLVKLVWRGLCEKLESSYERLIEQAESLYPSVQPTFSLADLKMQLRACS